MLLIIVFHLSGKKYTFFKLLLLPLRNLFLNERTSTQQSKSIHKNKLFMSGNHSKKSLSKGYMGETMHMFVFTAATRIQTRKTSQIDRKFTLVTRRPYCPGRPKELCFTTLSLAMGNMGMRLSVVKQSFFGPPGQYGRLVTRANNTALMAREIAQTHLDVVPSTKFEKWQRLRQRH